MRRVIAASSPPHRRVIAASSPRHRRLIAAPAMGWPWIVAKP
jgi:hypothetical protein